MALARDSGGYPKGLLDWGEAGYMEDEEQWPESGNYRQYYLFNVKTSAEYFCKDCLQLRLALIDPILGCNNCGSTRIIRGAVGSLDKEALKEKYKKETKNNMSRIIKVDFTGVESGGAMFTHVPEGDYALEVTKVLGKKGKESGKPNLRVSFKLSGGPKKGNGKTIEHNCSLQQQSLWNFRNLLEALGKEVPSKAVKIDVDKLIGMKCAGTLVDSEYEGRTKSEIATFFPLADLGNTGEAEDLEDELEATEETEEKPVKKGKKKAKPAEEEEETEETEESTEEEDELFS